jgi:uncharacterized membrane protein YfcA
VSTVNILLIALAVVSVVYIAVWIFFLRGTFGSHSQAADKDNPALAPQLGIGFLANFFDTLGVGSFAITSSIYKLLHAVPDDLIPGTMNVGHALPTITEAFFFIAAVAVAPRTLVSMIIAAVLGAWVGAGSISNWPKRRIQIGLGIALIAAAMLMLASIRGWFPVGGDAMGLSGTKLWIAIVANFCLGAIQQLGVGLYAPCMIMVYLLGMSPLAAFPIMMGSCAFLMPVGGYRFIKARRYSPKAALGLALGGIPGVIIAAKIVKSLPLAYVKWLVFFVVLYTSIMLLRSAFTESKAEAQSKTHSPQPGD